jgi:hypothetical protein
MPRKYNQSKHAQLSNVTIITKLQWMMSAYCGQRRHLVDGHLPVHQRERFQLGFGMWRHNGSIIAQNLGVVNSLLMISDKWYAQLGLLHVFISEILDVSFQPIVFADHCWEYQNWNNLLSVSLWTQVKNNDTDCVHTQQIRFKGIKNIGFWILRLQSDLKADVPIHLKLIFRDVMARTTVTHEHHFIGSFSCTHFSLSHGCHVEDAVSQLFGLCHRRWMTTPPLLITRFNSRDVLSLSSVKVIRYLLLNSTPRMHFPDRPSGEPLAGHQLDRTFVEALEDYRCGNFESGMSTNERTPYGSICDLQHLFHEFRSSSFMLCN